MPTVAPHAGVIDFGLFTPPKGGKDGIQGEVPAPLASQGGFYLSTNGWVPNNPGGGGSVTSVDTIAPLIGGPFTVSGAIGLAPAGVDNSFLAAMATQTLKGNNTVGNGPPLDLSITSVKAMLGYTVADIDGLGILATQDKVNLSTQATGTLQAAQFPALTGDITTVAGSLVTTIKPNTFALLAAANTFTANQTVKSSAPEIHIATDATTITGTPATRLKFDATDGIIGFVGNSNNSVFQLAASKGNIAIAADYSNLIANTYIYFYVDNTIVGRFDPAAALGDDTSVVTRIKGDARYLQSSGADLTLMPSAGFKQSCVVASAVPITLSGLQTIDGQSVLAGWRVLVTAQAAAKDNGIYIAGTGAWGRAPDADTLGLNLYGASVNIQRGTVYGGTQWTTSFAASSTIGTTAMYWIQSLTTLSGYAQQCRFATTGPIDLATNGTAAIDGVVMAVGDRVLVKNQTNAVENGIYIVGTPFTRAPDALAGGDNNLTASYTSVRRGTVNAGSQWACNMPGSLIIGTAVNNWYQIRRSDIPIRASDLNVSTANNIYPDYNMIDDAFYASSTGASYTLETTAQQFLGRRYASIQANAAVMRVETDWFPVEPSVDYLIRGYGWTQPGSAGATASTVYVETASDDGTGVATSLGQTLVHASTGAFVVGGGANINFTTPATARLMRFVGERAAGGTVLGRFGDLKVEKKARAATITSDLDLTMMPFAGFKQAVVQVADFNINLATGGLPTFDGFALTAGNRVLCIGQTLPAENGIYVAPASNVAPNNVWIRADDANGGNDLKPQVVAVQRGTKYGATLWQSTFQGTATVDTTPMYWYQIRRSDIPIRASDLNISPFYNVYPDYNMIDDAFYASSTGANYSFTAGPTVNLGQRYISITQNAAVMRVESDWFTVENSSEYLISAAAWLQSGAVGGGTMTVYVETASDDGTGVATSLGQTLVQTRTDAAYNAPASFASINFTTPGTARLMRFVGERAAGGNVAGRFGALKAEKKARAALMAADVQVANDARYATLATAQTITGAKTFGVPIKVQEGVLSSPSYSFVNDPSSGISRDYDVAGSIVFTTAGTEAMRLVNNTLYKGAASMPITGLSAGVYHMGAGAIANQAHWRFSNDANGPTIQMTKTRGTFAAPVINNANDVLGNTIFYGYDGGSFNIAGRVQGAADGAPVASSGNSPGKLLFWTATAGGTEIERLRIDSGGGVLAKSTGGLGYGAGAGGTVTQTVLGGTVTLNEPSGQIRMKALTTAANWNTFSMNNSCIGIYDTVQITCGSSGAAYAFSTLITQAGSVNIYFSCISAAGQADSPVFNFTITKGSIT